MSKTYHHYVVIDRAGEHHNIKATGYEWDFIPTGQRILKLKPIWNPGHGEFTDPIGIYLEEQAPDRAQPSEDDES